MKSGVRCCARCGKELALEGKPSRGATCTHCGAYLHSCVNCAFYSPGRHNDCREPQAEYVGDKRSSNFCDFFRFREADSLRPSVQTNPGGPSPRGKEKDARDRFDKLFGA
jgi:hypothetical protein